MLDNLKLNAAGQAEIVDFIAFMDGGTLILKMATVDNSELEIEFVQKRELEVTEEYPYPGRLLLNKKPVDIRSNLEANVLTILKNAVMVNEKNEKLAKRCLNESITFVKSKKYLQLTDSKAYKPWWKIG